MPLNNIAARGGNIDGKSGGWYRIWSQLSGSPLLTLGRDPGSPLRPAGLAAPPFKSLADQIIDPLT